MAKLSTLSDRALDLASAVGDNMKFMVPNAGTLLSTGAKLGAIRTGARMAGLFLRRHPAVTVATAAGAGLLWYAAYRRSQRAELGNEGGGNSRRVDSKRGRQALEGNATRVETREGNKGDGASTRRKSASTGSRASKRAGASRANARRGSTETTTSTTH